MAVPTSPTASSKPPPPPTNPPEAPKAGFSGTREVSNTVIEPETNYMLGDWKLQTIDEEEPAFEFRPTFIYEVDEAADAIEEVAPKNEEVAPKNKYTATLNMNGVGHTFYFTHKKSQKEGEFGKIEGSYSEDKILYNDGSKTAMAQVRLIQKVFEGSEVEKCTENSLILKRESKSKLTFLSDGKTHRLTFEKVHSTNT